MSDKSVEYHEAAHAALANNFGMYVTEASAQYHAHADGSESGGHVNYVWMRQSDEKPLVTTLRRLIICYAGPVAQRRYSPSGDWLERGVHDFDQARALARTVYDDDAQQRELLSWAHSQADRLVGELWHEVQSLAYQLNSAGAMDADAIADAIASADHLEDRFVLDRLDQFGRPMMAA